MAKFCGKCGSALEDDKCPKCSSKKEKREENETAHSIIEMLKKAFTEPVSLIIEKNKSKNYGLAWIIIAIKSIVFGLMFIALIKAINNVSLGYSYNNLGYYEYSYFKIFLSMALAYFAVENALIGLMNLFFKKVFKIKIKYREIFMINQFASIISIVTMAVGSILLMINSTLGIFILSLGLLLSSINLYVAFGEVAKEKKNFIGYAYVCAIAAFYLILWLITVLFR